jgi:M6 family metalloprotease-like protein
MPTSKLIPIALLLMLGAAWEASGAAGHIVNPLIEARLPNRSRNSPTHLGFPRPARALKSIGDIRIKTIFVDFSDAVSTRTPQSVFGLVSPGAENFWKVISYGKMNVTLDPVFRWLRMSKRSDEYGWSNLTAAAHKAYIQEAVNLAIAAGVDFSSSDTIAVMANPDAEALRNGPTYVAGGIVANGKTFAVAVTSGRDLRHWGYKWLNHEGGHMMGLADLYAFVGKPNRDVGDFSLMGLISGTAPEYFGWERWLLGWVDDDQVICAKKGTTTVTLEPIETPGGKKLVVIPAGATTAVVVESRRSLGFDHALVKAGPLAYLVDTSIGSGNGPLKVLPIDDNDQRKLNAPLAVGQTLSFSGVSVKFVSSDATAVTLEIVRP